LVHWNLLSLANRTIWKSEQPNNSKYAQYQFVALLGVPTLIPVENFRLPWLCCVSPRCYPWRSSVVIKKWGRCWTLKKWATAISIWTIPKRLKILKGEDLFCGKWTPCCNEGHACSWQSGESLETQKSIWSGFGNLGSLRPEMLPSFPRESPALLSMTFIFTKLMHGASCVSNNSSTAGNNCKERQCKWA